MLTKEVLKKMPEIDIIKIINDPNTSEDDYQAAANYLVGKYENQIHKHWWTLQKEIYNTGMAEVYKEEYYDEAYDALLKAIRKVDPDRVYDKKFKLVQLASWYLSNVRKKIRKKCLKQLSTGVVKSLNTMSREYIGDYTSLIDPDVERSYNESEGYKNDPMYILEEKESSYRCQKALEECMSIWNEQEIRVFKYLREGKTKKEIAEIMKTTPTVIYNISNRMKKDLSKRIFN